MPRYSAAALAFALGASALPAPQWHFWPSWGQHWPQPGDSYGAPEGGYAPPEAGYGAPEATSAPSFPSMTAIPSVEVPAPAPTGSAPPVYSSPPVAAPPVASTPAFSYTGVAANATAPAYVGAAASDSAVPSGSGSIPIVTSAPSAVPAPGGSGGEMPASSGTSVLEAVQTIAAGESFDGGMVMFDRGVSCTGQEEGGSDDAVFEIQDGGSLSNVIIGPNQIEGVHCYGSCTLTNVWWSEVCEDAFTIKEQADDGVTTITGGGAFSAEDKVLQHNGGGTMSVSGFTVSDFGKLYRSCGNCDDMPARHVILDDITASGASSELVGINSNYGDTATLSNIKVSDVDEICVTYTGNDTGDEPEENGSGPSESCIYSESDVTQI